MPPDLWLPGAIRVPGNNGLVAGAGGGRGKRFHTWHSFEAPYTLGTVAACRYLNSQGSTSTFTLHPITGEIGQMLPANQAARTLRVRDPRTGEYADINRYGDIHMQTEVIAYARRPWTLDLTDAGRDGLTRLMNFLRSWGIPDQWAWAGQPPPAYPGGSVRRRLPDQSGHSYHAGWPVNDHGDPGAIAAPWTTIAPKPEPKPDPNDGFATAHIEWVQTSLNTLGQTLAVDGSLGPATRAAVATYQTANGLTADGLPGPVTTTALEADMTTLADLAKTLADLPRQVWRAPITLHPLTRQALGTTDTAKPASYVLDTALRRAIGAWRKAHTAVNLARANADRLRGLETAMQELAANVPGVDAEAVTAAIQEAVGRYELALTRVADDEEEQA